jgi:hypothetical protein
VLAPSNVPTEPGRIVAETVPFASVSLVEWIVIVSVWSVPTRFDAVCGEISIQASAHVLLAFPQKPVQPAVTSEAVPVVRVTFPLVFPKPITELACTVLVPAPFDVIFTVHDAVVDPPA